MIWHRLHAHHLDCRVFQNAESFRLLFNHPHNAATWNASQYECRLAQMRRSVLRQCATVFMAIAIVAALLGSSGIAGAESGIGWILFVVFLLLAIVSFFEKTAGS